MLDIADPAGQYRSFRMNHLHPPFNTCGASRILMAMSQETTCARSSRTTARFGNRCPAYHAGHAALHEEGGEILKGPRNLAAAKRLLAESGYAGQPVTCLRRRIFQSPRPRAT